MDVKRQALLGIGKYGSEVMEVCSCEVANERSSFAKFKQKKWAGR